ncbi:MAG: hypothetical protein PHD88_07800 [Firmicutes bacterium]|nr:hypothetical protein [Bacillota bacterium]MDD4263493.1 hypothetical protein [Bacillota bacterium]MDD4694282.1 hypothetical protein [Bacillota bacterium]
MDEKEKRRQEFTKERELELFYTKTSFKRLRLTGLVSGVLMPWILAVIVLGSLIVVNLYDFMMWGEWEFDPSTLISESIIGLIVITFILAIIGYVAGGAFPKEKVRFFETDIYFSRPFSYFVLGLFGLLTPFLIVVWIIDGEFTLLGILSMFVISILVSLIAYPYWKAVFNKAIYYISDYDAVGQVIQENIEARSKQNVTREEEQETYRRFLEEMRKHRK